MLSLLFLVPLCVRISCLFESDFLNHQVMIYQCFLIISSGSFKYSLSLLSFPIPSFFLSPLQSPFFRTSFWLSSSNIRNYGCLVAWIIWSFGDHLPVSWNQCHFNPRKEGENTASVCFASCVIPHGYSSGERKTWPECGWPLRA